jgi:hypothetical protein
MRLHDARLVSIEIKPDDAVVIGFVRESGDTSRLLLGQVQRLRTFDFREGNIVLEVDEVCGVAPSVALLQRLFDLGADERPDYLRAAIARIEEGTLKLIHIVPSYGCELIALCGEAILTPQD